MNDDLPRRGLLAWAGLMALGHASAADKEAEAEKAGPPVPDRLGPDTPLGQTLDGKPVRLGDFDGRPVLIFFWASWCPHCRNELPVLERLQAKTGERLRIVAINVEERSVFRKLLRALGDSSRMLHTYDPGQSSAKATGAPGSLPYTMLLRGDGSVASTQSGWGDSSVRFLVEQVNTVLADTDS